MSTPAIAAEQLLPPRPSANFDFLFGRWQVRNRRVKQHLAGCRDWEEFDALQACRPMLGGLGNVDALVTDAFGNSRFVGMSTRLFDPHHGRWNIYWADNRRCVMDPPISGRFEAGVGTFHGRAEHQGTPVLMRFVWTADAMQPRWEQAFSTDDGGSGEPDWVMQLRRLP